MGIPNVLILNFVMKHHLAEPGYISCFQNNVDPYQLACHKQVDQDLTVFHSASKSMVETEIMQCLIMSPLIMEDKSPTRNGDIGLSVW